MFRTDVRLSVATKGGQVGPHDSVRRLAGPGLSPFVAKSASAQVKVSDGSDGLQRGSNVLAKTKHALATVDANMKWAKALCFGIPPSEE